MDAVGARQEAGEDGGARWLADDAGGDDGFQAQAFGSKQVEVRRLYFAAAKAVAIAALLVGGDEEDVGLGHGGLVF